MVERARIVLRAGDGLQDKEIAAELGIQPEKAARWRNRFLNDGWAALQKDAPRSGRLRMITEAHVKRVVEKPHAARTFKINSDPEFVDKPSDFI